jgi:hypothetical protein
MSPFTTPFWDLLFKLCWLAGMIFGGLGIALASISAWIGYQRAEDSQREADIEIAKAHAQSDEARAEAAKAIERAAEAEKRAVEAQLDLIKFREPRRINSEQRALITKKLLPFPGVKFDVGWARGNDEQDNLAWELEPALTDAGWQQLDWPGGTILRPGYRPDAGEVSASNVSIQISPKSEAQLKPAALALVAALNDEGIAARLDPFNIRRASAGIIHVLIGMKR